MMNPDDLGRPVDLILQGLLLGALIWLAARALRRDAAALRHALAVTGLSLLLVLPLGLLIGKPDLVLFEREIPVVEPKARPVALSLLDRIDPGDSTAVTAPRGDENPIATDTGTAETSTSSRARDEGVAAAGDIAAAPVRPQPSGREVAGFSAATWLLAAWGLGAFFLLLRRRRARRRLAILLATSSRASGELRIRVEKAAARVGLKRVPRVHVCEGLDSPAVTGILRTRLLLPRDLIDELDPVLLEPLLLHEMVHLRRRDPLLQALARVVGWLHWYNPFALFLRRMIERDRELLTDAAVLALESKRSPYAEGLLRVVGRGERGARIPASALGLFGGDGLRERLTRVVSGETVQPARLASKVALLGVVVMLGVCVSEIGLAGSRVVRAAEPQDEERVEVTLRVRVLPFGERREGRVFQVKKKRLDPGGLSDLLKIYSVVADPKYDDGHGLSSTRVIVEVPAEKVEADLQAVIIACAKVKIYRIEIEGGVKEAPAGDRLVVELLDGGELRIGGKTLDPAVPVETLRSILGGSRSVLIRVPRAVPHREVVRLMDRLHDAGAESITLEMTRIGGAKDAGLTDERKASLRRASPGKTIDAALAFLARQQDERGAFRDPEPGGRRGQEVGRTAVALLAFLGAGETPKAGPHKDVVRRAAEYLLARQDEDGFIGDRKPTESVYGHAMAGLALSELLGLSGDPRYRKPVEKAVAWTIAAQNPYKGWRYGVRDGDNDTAITSWMMTFLKSARLAEVEVPEVVFDYGLSYLGEMTDPKTGRTGYMKTGVGNPPVRVVDGLRSDGWRDVDTVETATAMASFARLLCGEKEEKVARSRRVLRACPPRWDVAGDRIDLVYWYFGTLAMYQGGGPGWQDWNLKLRDALLDRQETKGDQAGSWPAVGLQGDLGGRVFDTALATLALEVSWRYARATGPIPK